MLRLGVDLGGTKIEIIALGDDGSELLRRRIATPKDGYEAVLQAIAELVHTAERELEAQGTVGIGTPGAISKATHLLKNSNSVCLNGRAMLRDLEAILARPVRIENDANCFALSEARDGAAAGASVVFGVIVGTGTGGGVVVNGQVLTGANGIAGEWGHNALPWPEKSEYPGPACYCGRKGCIETYLSGPGMARDHEWRSGERLEPVQIVRRARGGDALCEATLRSYEHRMARSLAHVINILDPEVIVLGGGMSNISRLYVNVPRLWGKYIFSDTVETRLLPPKHCDSSGVRGAAWLP